MKLLQLCCWLLTSIAVPAWGAMTFTGLGDLSGGDSRSYANGISADGSTIVGWSRSAAGDEAFRWTATNGMIGLGILRDGNYTSEASSVSIDGEVVVGWSSSGRFGNTIAGGDQAFKWTNDDGMIGLGDLPGGNFESYAYSVSADGATIVGQSETASGGEAFRWTANAGMVGLGHLSEGDFNSEASGVSDDGSTIVGSSRSTSVAEAFRWTADDGMTGLGDLPEGGFYSEAVGVSDDGAVIAGTGDGALGLEAFYWTNESGIVGLGTRSVARDISNDGTTIVGYRDEGSAFIWDANNGMRNIQDLLIAAGIDVTGWELYDARGVSADGQVIVGNGFNANANREEAWMVNLAASPEASADFNADGIINSSDLHLWKQHFGQELQWGNQGDANFDGCVNGDDFLIWQRQFTDTDSIPSHSPVPEPPMTPLRVLPVLLLLSRRKSK